MLRFLEFLGLVTVFFIIVFAVTFFFMDRPTLPSSDDTKTHVAEPVPMGQPMSFAQGQCSVIEMYSMSWCGYCRIKRQEFQSRNIAFNEYILDQDPAAERGFKRKMKQMNIRRYGYPTFFINGLYTKNFPTDSLLKKTCS